MRLFYTAIMAALLLSVISMFLAPSLAMAQPAAAPPTCRDIVFSDDDNVDYGCVIAAALDLYSPPTVEGVRGKVKAMTPKALEAFNAHLERTVRRYVWLIFDYIVGEKGKVYDSSKDGYLDVAAIAELLRTDATLLDLAAIGRWNLPHQPVKKAATKPQATKATKAKPQTAAQAAVSPPAGPPVSGVVE